MPADPDEHQPPRGVGVGRLVGGFRPRRSSPRAKASPPTAPKPPVLASTQPAKTPPGALVAKANRIPAGFGISHAARRSLPARGGSSRGAMGEKNAPFASNPPRFRMGVAKPERRSETEARIHRSISFDRALL